jgi:signal transduction histidine kinase
LLSRPTVSSARWQYGVLLVIAICALFVTLSDEDGYAVVANVLHGLAANAALVVAGSIAACLALLAVMIGLRSFDQSVSIARLVAEIERQDAEGTPAALSDVGSPSIARLTQAINGMRRRHAERIAELIDVQAAYAHDLRTPLTRMSIRCESLDDTALHQSMNRDLEEMNELVEASLACARMQYSAGKPLGLVDADQLLGHLVGGYWEAGHSIELDGRVAQPVLTCPHALRRVLENLIDNGLRYGGDVRLSVRVEAQRVVFTVSDPGPGIEPSEMEAVFTPWYRAPHTAARASGTGLGLAIARRLTLAMRGELQLKNRRTGGLEALLTLPLVLAQS